MVVFSLGVRNVYRNGVRATLVILVLGLSVGLVVTMLKTSANTRAQAQTLKSQIATLITVGSAGQPVGGSGWQILPGEIAGLKDLPRIAGVERYARRQFVDNTRRLQASYGVVIGVEPGATLRLSAMGGFVGSPKIIEGRNFVAEDRDKAVAVVGKVFADERGLKIGSRLVIPVAQLKGRGIPPKRRIQDLKAEVIGIFSVGVVWGDNQVFIPLSLAQKVLDMDGGVSVYYITASSAEHVPPLAKSLKKIFGKAADVISQDAAATKAANSMEEVSSTSRFGATISAGVGALVVLFTMMLVTRERTREIGILKAIGASNSNVAGLFVVETIALATVGAVLGLLIYAAGGSLLANLFLGSIIEGALGGTGFGLSLGELAYGLGLAILFGIIGSLYPVYHAIKMRPSEAIRHL